MFEAENTFSLFATYKNFQILEIFGVKIFQDFPNPKIFEKFYGWAFFQIFPNRKNVDFFCCWTADYPILK